MRAQTISLRLPEKELDMLSILAERMRTTKTEIIRNALKPVFETNFDKPHSVILNNHDFQELLNEIATSPSEEVLERRRHLEEFALWDSK